MPQAWDNPDVFVGRNVLSSYEPYPLITASAVSSMAPANIWFLPWMQPTPVNVSSIRYVASMNVGVPGATSQASTGSEAYTYGHSATLFSRQDFSANSSKISAVSSMSFAVSASLGYSSTSQQFGMSWVTDSTGGVANYTTTSGDAGWSTVATGFKYIDIPFAATLSAGEWWIGMQHSSTSATSNSNVTLMSFSRLIQQWQNQNVGVLGAAATATSARGYLGTAVTTSAAMAISNLTSNANVPYLMVNHQ